MLAETHRPLLLAARARPDSAKLLFYRRIAHLVQRKGAGSPTSGTKIPTTALSTNHVLKLRAAKRKQEIGFESQTQKQAEETGREARETRKQELHGYAVMLAEAKVDHQYVLTGNQRLPLVVAAAEEVEKLEARKPA